jgi:excisionase family DNA binding protein
VTPEPMVDVKAVATMLGLKPYNVYDKAERGVLPAYKLEGLWRFRVSEIEAWLQKRRTTIEARA